MIKKFLNILLVIGLNISYVCADNIEKIVAKSEETTKQENADFETLAKKYENLVSMVWSEDTKGVIHRINTEEKIVALTFDLCGSANDSLDENLISFLEQNKICATFFVNKRWIIKYPQKFERLYKNPLFEIENHGLNHKPASINGNSIYNIEGTKNAKELIEEIEENGKFIESITKRKPIFYRSGTAYYDEYAVEIANNLGYIVMGFSILGDCGATYSARKVKRQIKKAKSGDILIFHANHPEKATGKGVITGLPKLQKKGFTFVKLENYKNLLY